MKRSIAFLVILIYSVSAHAAQKYNPYTNKWETTSEDATVQYNPYDNTWSYQQPGSQVEYNPYENEWEWAPPERNDSGDEDYF